jgi:hypothetical protein
MWGEYLLMCVSCVLLGTAASLPLHSQMEEGRALQQAFITSSSNHVTTVTATLAQQAAQLTSEITAGSEVSRQQTAEVTAALMAASQSTASNSAEVSTALVFVLPVSTTNVRTHACTHTYTVMMLFFFFFFFIFLEIYSFDSPPCSDEHTDRLCADRFRCGNQGRRGPGCLRRPGFCCHCRRACGATGSTALRS